MKWKHGKGILMYTCTLIEYPVLYRKYDECVHKHSREMDSLKRQWVIIWLSTIDYSLTCCYRNIQELQVYQDERKKHHEDMEQCRMENEMQEMAIKQLETAIADKVVITCIHVYCETSLVWGHLL